MAPVEALWSLADSEELKYASFNAVPAVASLNEFVCNYYDDMVASQLDHVTPEAMAALCTGDLVLPNVVSISCKSQVLHSHKVNCY